MSKITNSMFESIRGALAASDDKSSSGPVNILKTEPGNTYTLRLLPYKKDPTKTFHHYQQHGWNSFATGQYVSAISPAINGDRDPIGETRYKLYRGNDQEKAMAGKIVRSEKWLANVYVVNDPVNPDNNGTVMILRYGKQLHKIIANAIDGEDASDLGPRIFDLSPNGCNFKVIVEKQGDFPTYVSSKFSFPSEIPGMDDEKVESLLDSTYDLASTFNIKSFDDLKQMVDEHIYCSADTQEEEVAMPQVQTSVPEVPVVENKPVEVTTPVAQEDKNEDEEIKDLLAGLDI